MPEQENQTPEVAEEEKDQQVPGTEGEDNAEDSYETDEDELYEGGGFDPEQRRLLWTIAIVIIIGIFAATWLDITYADRRASRTLKANEVLGNYNRAHQRFTQEQEQSFSLLGRAMMQNDQQGVEAIMKALVGAYKDDYEAAAALHHEEGVEDPQLSRDDINNFANGILNNVGDRVDQMRRAHAAATQSSSTQPAPASTAPTGSPLLPPNNGLSQ